jgi:hypothetical protein
VTIRRWFSVHTGASAGWTCQTSGSFDISRIASERLDAMLGDLTHAPTGVRSSPERSRGGQTATGRVRSPTTWRDRTQERRVRSPLGTSVRSSRARPRLSAYTNRTRRSSRGQRPVTHSDLLISPLFLRRVDPLQLQTLLLCKCANTTKCTPPCVCMLAFSQSFLRS